MCLAASSGMNARTGLRTARPHRPQRIVWEGGAGSFVRVSLGHVVRNREDTGRCDVQQPLRHPSEGDHSRVTARPTAIRSATPEALTRAYARLIITCLMFV
jgi:hypothetical protein